MKNQFLLLTQTSPNDWALREWRKNGVTSYIIFKNVCSFLKIIRRVWLFFSFPFLSIWLTKGVKEACLNSKIVVVHISSLSMKLPRYINKINPNAKVIAWYWNSVNNATLPQNIRGLCELWSFDPADCEKYGMMFNHQYYFKTLKKKNNEVKYDVFFCGSDSGRGEFLMDLYSVLKKLNLKVLFKIVYPQFERIPEELQSKPISYENISEFNVCSKAILEVTRPGQSGATVRLMEALFLNKKIITNNLFVKEEPFYNERNIFLLGTRSVESLKEFINSDYDCRVEHYIDEYDFINWLNRFVE